MRKLCCFITALVIFYCFTSGYASAASVAVREGDTLWSIARKAGVSLEGICRLNGISDPDCLRVGQVLIVPDRSNSEPGIINASSVNLRKGPGMEFEVVSLMEKGRKVNILAERDNWSLICTEEGLEGWVTAVFVGRRQTVVVSRSSRPADEIITLARRFLDVPYVWGGSSPAGFDCSGFAQTVYGLAGIKLPRRSLDQFRAGMPVAIEDLLPGDALFFTTYAAGASHTGIYLGNDCFIHASSAAGKVVITPFTGFYRTHYVGARRFTQ